MTWNK